jgi:putative tryptophan/tyrosine transport system substrate-binding protein
MVQEFAMDCIPRLCQTRRGFVQVVTIAGLALLAGCGRLAFQDPAQQPAKVYRIGWLNPSSPSGSSLEYEAFQEGLRSLGYHEGYNITIDARYAEGQSERLPDLVAEMVSLQPDVIVTARSTLAARAAKAGTSTIPVVFAGIGDPVGTGLVSSYAHPGGNVTGLTSIAAELSGKRLQLLKEAVPGITRVAAIWNASDPAMAREFGETQVAAEALGVELHSFGVRERGELEGAYEAAKLWRADAIVLIADQLITLSRTPLVALSAQNRLPTISSDRGFATAGGLMAYGPDLLRLHRRAAYYVDRILKGAKPADLPVERPMTFDLVINSKTARELAIRLPQSLLLQTTEVTE